MNKQTWIFIGLLLALVLSAPLWYQNQEDSPKNKNNHSNQKNETVFLASPKNGEPATYITKSRPKNVILMIGDGMGLSQITAGAIAKQDQLALEKFRHIGLIKTYSTKLITDSAAGATAMATGSKTYNGAISMNVKQENLKTILEYAEEDGWKSGVVTTATVTHATPACFYGHQPKRSKVNRKLAAQFLAQDIEILMGGGWNYFKDGPDGRDLIEEAQEKGYFVSNDIKQVGDYRPERILCLISPLLPPKLDERGNFLPLATQKSIEILDHAKTNFFLMIEGAQIDWGGHSNKSDYLIEEMLDFDRAVAQALAFAEKDGNTLVVVTADHETGGYSINGGDLKKGEVQGKFTSDYHTATMVPVFAYGPGAESFAGVYDNTEIFFKLKHLMQVDKSNIQ